MCKNFTYDRLEQLRNLDSVSRYFLCACGKRFPLTFSDAIAVTPSRDVCKHLVVYPF